MIFVFFSSYPMYINLLLRYCENYKIKLKSYDNKINCKTRVVIYGSVLERHVRHRFTEA